MPPKPVLHNPSKQRCPWLPALLCFVLAVLVLIPVHGWSMSLSKEKELGRKYLKLIQQHFPMVTDGDIISYVESVGNRVVARLGPTPYAYRFYLIDNNTINAFTIPGGDVFLFRGIIAMMDSEDELASIISHELAHSQAHHLERRMEQSKLLNIATIAGTLAAVFLGLPPETMQAVAIGAQAGSRTMQLKYSRENEEEADRIGFHYLGDAGYNPEAMVTVMQKMKKNSWSVDPKIPSYLLTHPGITERITYLQAVVKQAKKKPKKPATTGPTGDFQLMQAALIGVYSEPEIAENQFKLWLNDKDRQGAAWYGLGRLALREGRHQKAYEYLKKAVTKRPQSPLILSSLGLTYYYLGDLQAAETTLHSAILMDPSSSAAHYRLALVLQDQGNLKGALRQLQQVEHLSDVVSEVNYQTGIIYGKLNQLGLAHYYLARYYERKDIKLAIFHYNKAKALLPPQDIHYDDIDEALKDLAKQQHKKTTDTLRPNS